MARTRNPSYPALLLNQNSRRFFFTTIPVSDLFPYCFVSRRDDDPKTGFQRTLNQARAQDIARYLKEGRGSIPTNVVLSAQPEAAFTYRSRVKQVSFARKQSGFLVLDGQHRLWGYDICRQQYGIDHRVPCAVYVGLDRAEETRLFIDINTLQRGVSAELLLDIKQMAMIESQSEAILRDLFDRLSKDSKSALNGRLSASRAVKNKLSRVTFNRAIGKALKGAILSNSDQETRFALVRNYVNAFDAELVNKRALTSPAYFEAIFEVLEQVVQRAFDDVGNAKQASIQNVIRPLMKIELVPSDGRTRMTTAGIVTAYRSALQRQISINKSLL